ncbi:MAG TPA: hypothetical protein VI794_00825, partial [Patescibacteria group bacterium]|nr:hypothetical protein [Patescibacteria group bacterium]
MASKFTAVKKYFSKFWDAGFVFQNVFIPLAVLTLYFVLSAYLLPDGVTRIFASDLWKPSLALTILSGLAFFGILKLKKSSKLVNKRTSEK